MDHQPKLEQIMKTGSIPAVSGEGIRLYDTDGNTYYDLNEISNIMTGGIYIPPVACNCSRGRV